METVHKRIAVHNGHVAVAYVRPHIERSLRTAEDDEAGSEWAPIDRGYLATVHLSNENETTAVGSGDTIEEAVDDVAQRI